MMLELRWLGCLLMASPQGHDTASRQLSPKILPLGIIEVLPPGKSHLLQAAVTDVGFRGRW